MFMSDSKFIEGIYLPCDLGQEANISGHWGAVGVTMWLC